jgi:hypothetical protein
VQGIVKIACGLRCGCALSQFPEYSQQYVQRMGGALDELATVVQDFDASAETSGYTREEALDVMKGSDFLEARQADMRRTFTRFDRLTEDYSRLEKANSFSRLAYVARMRDGEISSGTAGDFKPAVPVTFDGFGFIAIGFAFGYGLLAGFLRLFRRKKQVEA